MRLTVVVPNEREGWRRLSAAITKAGGDIIALGTFLADDPTQGRLTVKIGGIAKEKVLKRSAPSPSVLRTHGSRNASGPVPVLAGQRQAARAAGSGRARSAW